ncbi:MAG: hypothetical protein R8G66_17880 [Cytophagales bacterium]|nr:hypothetical protein [Cytophagales bacterium]
MKIQLDWLQLYQNLQFEKTDTLLLFFRNYVVFSHFKKILTGVICFLTFSNATGQITYNSDNVPKVTTTFGYLEFGPKTAIYSHFKTDRSMFHFNKEIRVGGAIGSYTGNLTLQAAGNTAITVLNSNRYVGIGIGTPENRLHVEQSCTYNNTVYGAAFRISSPGSASAVGNYHSTIAMSRGTGHVAISAVQEHVDSDVMGIAFFTHPGTTGGDPSVEQVRIDHDGNVGIGTDNPEAKLHVEQNKDYAGIAYDAGIRIKSNSNIGLGNYHGTLAIGRGLGHASISAVQEGIDEDELGLAFFTHPSAAATSPAEEKVRIDKDGNVGIGTTSPEGKLHVEQSDTYGGLAQNAGIRVKSVNSLSGEGNHHSTIALGRGTGHVAMSAVQEHYDSDVMGIAFFTHPSTTGGDQAVEQVRIDHDGNMGIGTDNPEAKLHVEQPNNYAGSVYNSGIRVKSPGSIDGIGNYHSTIALSRGIGHVAMSAVQEHNDSDVMGIAFFTHPSTTGGDPAIEKVRIDHDGNMGIGTTTPTQKLSVAGTINAEELLLEDVQGADFVFEEDYDLRSLEETEQFIKANKHLPEIPSAAEMAEEGLEIKTMNILLLQKVEELTLHLIRQEKEMKDMQEEIQALKSSQNNH